MSDLCRRAMCVAFVLVMLTSCGATSPPGQQSTAALPVGSPTPIPLPVPVSCPTLPPVLKAPAIDPGRVPDVVGVQHQLAQDTMEAAGFSNLTEEDATGAAREVSPDREWVVVEQFPAPGTPATAADMTVILRSKRVGE